MVLLSGLLFGSGGFGAAAETADATGRVVLQVLPGEETGLKVVMEAWKAEELQRQGGKFGDHGWWLWGLVVMDYDRDGDLDLVIQQHGAPQSIVVRNQLKETGKLTFTNANAELGLPPNGLAGCFTPAVWDFDGDGWVDLAYCDALHNTCFFNRQGKGFEPMGFVFGQLAGISPPVDLNGDGTLDVTSVNDGRQYLYDAAARKFTSRPWEDAFHANPPDAVKAAIEEVKPKIVPRYLHFHEHVNLTGKGPNDLVCGYFGSYGGAIFGRYLIADKDGKFRDATEELGLPKTGTPILMRDVSGDGIDDVLIVGAGLYLSDGKGKFELKSGPLTQFLKDRRDYIHRVSLVDFANAGRYDLVVQNGRGATARIFENLGGGDFRETAKASTWVDAITVCDINGDGLTDVLIGGPAEDVTIYLNRTPHPGNYADIYPVMDKPNPYAVGTRVEAYRAGEMARPGARPFAVDTAHPDATSVHVGLGDAATFDLRVTFPGKTPKVVEWKDVKAVHRLKVTPDGKRSVEGTVTR
jgi:hypothetical protein